jgi:tight adherence protein C
LFGWFLPGILIKNTIEKRQEEINITFPDALDMILVCVQGGISIEQAIVRISEEVADQSQILAEELGLLSAELGLLSDRRQAFADFAERVGGGAAKSFGTAMVQAEKYGTSISQALRVMADELREIRMSEAERKAAALPPKLTVPMIAFFLPPLFIAILGPAFIQIQ